MPGGEGFEAGTGGAAIRARGHGITAPSSGYALGAAPAASF
jgi:hypothetical protein